MEATRKSQTGGSRSRKNPREESSGDSGLLLPAS